MGFNGECKSKSIVALTIFGDTMNKIHSQETKSKISLALMGHSISEETRNKLSMAKKGNKNSLGFKHSEKTKLKMSLVKLGNKVNLGRKLSEERKKQMSKFIEGCKNPLWKGGIYSRNNTSARLQRLNWRIASAKARKRDNNTCQKCGFVGGQENLDVHHIVPSILTGNDSVDNLITLCAVCHPAEESKFWKSINYLKILANNVGLVQ